MGKGRGNGAMLFSVALAFAVLPPSAVSADPCAGGCAAGSFSTCTGVCGPADAFPCTCDPGYSANATGSCVTVPAFFTVTKWSECSTACGAGVRRRNVTCVSTGNGTAVPVSLCDGQGVPSLAASCNTFSCDLTDTLLHVSVGIEYDFLSFAADWLLYNRTLAAVAYEVSLAMDTAESRFSFLDVTPSSKAVGTLTFDILPSATSARNTTQLATSLQLLVSNATAVDAVPNTWLRKMNASTFVITTPTPQPAPSDAKIELIVTIAVVAAAVIGVIVGCSCKPSSVSSDDTPYTDLAQPLLRDEPDAEAPPAAEGSDDGWGRASPEPIHDDTVEVIPLEGGVTLTPTRAPAPGVSDLNTSINN